MSFRDFDKGIPSSQINRQREHEKVEQLRHEMFRRWRESERILGILRSAGSVDESFDGMESWFHGIKGLHRYHATPEESPLRTPNDWFCRRFPEVRERFGDAFYEEEAVTVQGSRVIRPLVINEDFFAAMLGGESSLGHRLVYLPGEGFLYLDPRMDAYVSTSEEKVGILLSNYLFKCAGEMGGGIDRQLLIQNHRSPRLLAMIVKRSKTVLEAAQRFFEANSGRRIFKNGRILETQGVSSPEHFIHHAFAPEEGASVVAGEAYQGFLRHCQARNLILVEFKEFKQTAKDLIMEKYQLGLRHDIRTAEGRQTHGWKHLRLLPAPELGHGAVA